MVSKSPQVKQPQKQQQKLDSQILSQQWSGPLPPPAALEQFNNIIPNGAQRIMAMVEAEQAHRIASDTRILAADIADGKRGMWIGFFLALVAIGGAVYTAFIGANPWVSIALVSYPLFLLIKAFIGKG